MDAKEEQTHQAEEVGGVWLVGSVEEVRHRWQQSELTDAVTWVQGVMAGPATSVQSGMTGCRAGPRRDFF